MTAGRTGAVLLSPRDMVNLLKALRQYPDKWDTTPHDRHRLGEAARAIGEAKPAKTEPGRLLARIPEEHLQAATLAVSCMIANDDDYAHRYLWQVLSCEMARLCAMGPPVSPGPAGDGGGCRPMARGPVRVTVHLAYGGEGPDDDIGLVWRDPDAGDVPHAGDWLYGKARDALLSVDGMSEADGDGDGCAAATTDAAGGPSPGADDGDGDGDGDVAGGVASPPRAGPEAAR